MAHSSITNYQLSESELVEEIRMEEETFLGEISFIDIDSVECIPDIIINSFEPETLPDVEDHRNFFLTVASERIFNDMKNSKFFNCLRSTKAWKLYVSELMFGVLFYEAPWTEQFQSNYFLKKMRDTGRIVVLKKGVGVEVPLSQVSRRVTNCDGLRVMQMKHGQITQMLEFEIKKTDGTTLQTTHLGTVILEDIVSGGTYTEVNTRTPGFPQIFKHCPVSDEEESSMEEDTSSEEEDCTNLSQPLHRPVSEAKELTDGFSAVLNRIRQKLEFYPDLHFKLVTSSADKLISLWYMKHLSEEFGLKVHVDQYFFSFIQKFLPEEFLPCFTTTNAQSVSRFHFNCCDSWGKYFENQSNCCPEGRNPREFEFDFICIGYGHKQVPSNLRVPKSTLCIPYIHEIIYDF